MWDNFVRKFHNREFGSQPPSLENPFVGQPWEHDLTTAWGLNLQAWRIPLWVSITKPYTNRRTISLNLQAWRIPLWGEDAVRTIVKRVRSLNLQAWRIPLWEIHSV